ncbi:ABC transporter substrate-binding protein [Actinospica durhamensis]|uniref:ABC transporter substrate-binding protein n=1 Tax=Actinospica durhamensis TaxID=1508375 RepID=A0A941IT10_9ACTN|nr:ABC transporter substrate-binding protein [Actinospica durhamensis]MBR7839159.1 ABC transporter substrate-binding protein [Actinospica durhamensis]
MPQPIGAPWSPARPTRPRARRRSLGALGLSLALAAVTVSACSSSSGSVETPDLKVGYVNGMGAATFLIGMKAGYFNQNGLNVSYQEYNSDVDLSKALKDGSVQIGLGDYTSVLDTQASGSIAGSVQVVGEAYSSGDDTIGLIARANSGLANEPATTVAAGIANAHVSVGVPTYDSPEYVALAAWAMSEQTPLQYKIGTVHPVTGDPDPADTAKQIISAVSSGAYSTGVLQEPYLTQALETGKVVELANLSSGTAADMPISGYFALTKFTEQNPNTIATFDAALAQAQTAGSSRVAVEDALETQSMTNDLAVTVQFGNFPSTVVPATIDNVLTLMNGAGLSTGTLSSGTLTSSGTTVTS